MDPEGLYGAAVGTPFRLQAASTAADGQPHGIKAIHMRVGDWIQQIKLEYRDDTVSPAAGGSDGNAQSFHLDEGQCGRSGPYANRH